MARAGLLLALLGGCERSLPWSGEPDGAVIDESTPFLPGRPEGGAPPPLDDSAPAASLDLPPPSRLGGLWSSCRDGFRLGAVPLRDVTRLGLMCGPVNGMTPLGDAREGELRAGGEGARHPLPVRAGGCYRVFAIAGEGIDDLEVQIRSSRGTRLGADELRGRVALVDPERPFCTFADDELEIRVASAGGSGRYALEVWHMAGPR